MTCACSVSFRSVLFCFYCVRLSNLLRVLASIIRPFSISCLEVKANSDMLHGSFYGGTVPGLITDQVRSLADLHRVRTYEYRGAAPVLC